jgi:hypothetical protein
MEKISEGKHPTEGTFALGRVVLTPGALGMATSGVNVGQYLGRHCQGDWGDLSESDKSANDFAVSRDLRIFSAYETAGGLLWVITEADRSVTTFLLPSEY